MSNRWPTEQIIVTGALGWLGLRLVQTLVAGLPDHEQLRGANPRLKIRALALPGQDATALRKISPQVEVMEGDLRDPAAAARLCANAPGAILFHTAGIIHPRRVREFYEVNVDGGKNILAAAEKAGVRRAVVVSSNSPFGCNPQPDHLFDENSPYHPYRHYGRSKMLLELAVQEVVAKGRLETVVIRPPWFYGPYQPPRQTLFFGMIRDGKAPIVGGGNNLRSMSYIDNLCQGLQLAALAPQANGQAYWIADRRPYSMNEIVATVERLLETEFQQKCAHKRLRLPSLASEVASVCDAALQGIGHYHQKIHVLSEMNQTIACSVARAERELGYQPAVALEEGMRRSLRWCFENNISF